MKWHTFFIFKFLIYPIISLHLHFLPTFKLFLSTLGNLLSTFEILLPTFFGLAFLFSTLPGYCQLRNGTSNFTRILPTSAHLRLQIFQSITLPNKKKPRPLHKKMKHQDRTHAPIRYMSRWPHTHHPLLPPSAPSCLRATSSDGSALPR